MRWTVLVLAEMDDKKEIHRVHFEVNKDVIGKDNEVVIQSNGGRRFEIHLGFLQLNHKYSITFSIPRGHCNSDDVKAKPVCLENNSQHLRNLTVTECTDKILFFLELFAYKEKLMSEEFNFNLSDEKDVFTVTLKARVLGKGKGTPLLKNGIHVIEHPVDSDSSSD